MFSELVIREFKHIDIPQQRMLYNKFFANNEYPEFEHGYNAVFAVQNENSEIVSIAGIRPIAEVVALSNMDMSVKDRRAALITLFQALGYAAARYNYKQLHAFVHDNPAWVRHLGSMDFKESEAKVLILDLE